MTYGRGLTGAFVSRLSTTAIKGFALEHPDEIELAEHGAVGDRDLLVVDERLGLVSATRAGAFLALRATLDRGAGAARPARRGARGLKAAAPSSAVLGRDPLCRPRRADTHGSQ